jgi:hypothetical protein
MELSQWLDLHCAVLSLRIACRILVENVCVEEVTDLWWASVFRRMSRIVLCLRGTVRGAKLGIETTCGENGGPHISVITLMVVGSIDGSILRDSRQCETWRGNQIRALISVRTSDDHLELIAVLARVGSTIGSKRPTPEDALHIGDTAGIGTSITRARVNARISLKVDVEGQTASSLGRLES